MNRTLTLFAALFLSTQIIAFSDQAEQTITLKDGSQIKGILSGVDNGVYTVKTPVIGDIHVSQNDVASITNGNAPAALPLNNSNFSTTPNPPFNSTGNMDQQIAASQQKLMSNPQSMATLQEMMQDPEIMQALQDPALVQAVTTHNYQAVSNNPKIQEMLSNPKMQALLQKLAQEQQQGSSQ